MCLWQVGLVHVGVIGFEVEGAGLIVVVKRFIFCQEHLFQCIELPKGETGSLHVQFGLLLVVPKFFFHLHGSGDILGYENIFVDSAVVLLYHRDGDFQVAHARMGSGIVFFPCQTEVVPHGEAYVFPLPQADYHVIGDVGILKNVYSQHVFLVRDSHHSHARMVYFSKVAFAVVEFEAYW